MVNGNLMKKERIYGKGKILWDWKKGETLGFVRISEDFRRF
jgi:hypothetical protein